MNTKVTKFGFVRRAALPLLASVALLLSPGARAQRRVAPPPRVQPARPQQQLKQPRPAERRMLNLPPAWADRLRNMTPEQQDRFLENNRQFQNLPPARQAQIRNQLQRWNNLSPNQQQALLDRDQVWQNMTPAQQRYVRNTLLPQWQGMAPARRQLILKKLRDLRGMDDAQRAAKLNDESFNSGLDPGERQMLRDLANLRVTEPIPPGF